MKREEQPSRDNKSISQYLLCPEVVGQHREQTAITDTKTDAIWHQHLWGKSRISRGHLSPGASS